MPPRSGMHAKLQPPRSLYRGLEAVGEEVCGHTEIARVSGRRARARGARPDFTTTEARECLRRHGCDWGEVREDVCDTLRRPILAGLYCRVAKGGGWAPHNEYEIYARHWRDVTDKREQLHHPSVRLTGKNEDHTPRSSKGLETPWPPCCRTWV